MHPSIAVVRNQIRLLRHAVKSRIGEEVSQWANPAHNPFLQKELRGLARHGGLLRLALWTWFSIFFFNALGWGTWFAARAGDKGLAAQFPSLEKLPAFLGSNALSFSVLLSTLACFCVVVIVAPFANALQQEVLRGTIDQLRLIPQPEERWLWMTRAYPSFRALVVWCHGLPIFALAIFLDQWSIFDALGLLLFFLFLSLVVPAYMPATWQQQAAQKKKALAENASKQPAVAQGDTQSPEKTETSQTGNARDSSGLEALAAMGFSIPVLNMAIVVFVLGVMGGAAYGSAVTWYPGNGFVSAFMHRLRLDAPPIVQQLWPALPLTAPYVVARLLFTPLPFFASSLPPIVLWLPFVAATRRFRMAEIAEKISESSLSASEVRQRSKTLAARVVAVILCTAPIGYGWKLLMGDGAVTTLVNGSNTTPDWSTASAWTVIVVIAALSARLGVRSAFKKQSPETSRAEVWRQSLNGVVKSFAIPLTGYFVSCWLGGFSGWSASWLSRLPLTLATVAAFTLQAFGANALAASLSKRLRPIWFVLTWCWSYLPLLIFSIFAFRAITQDFALADWTAHPYILLSPYTALAFLFSEPAPVFRSPVGWLWWPLILQAAFGVATTAAACHLSFYKAHAEQRNSALKTLFSIILLPLSLTTKSLKAVIYLSLRKLKALDHWLGNYDRMLMQQAGRWDNPIIIAELRRRKAATNSSTANYGTSWAILFAFEAIATTMGLIMIFVSPRYEAKHFSYLVIGLLGIISFIHIIGGCSLGGIFKKDKINGHLTFLVLTPLTSREIMLGKVVLNLGESFLFWLTTIPWFVVITLVSLIAGNGASLIISLFGLPAAFSTFLLFAAACTSYACRPGPYTVEKKRKSRRFLAESILPALAIWLFFASVSIWCTVQGANTLILCLIFISATITQSTLAKSYWEEALDSLEEQRSGDVALQGKLLHT